MAITRSIASSNLMNAVQRKNADIPVEKKMATRNGLQRAALGNISNKGMLKADAQKALKDKKIVEKVTLKKTTVVVNASDKQPPSKQIQQLESVVSVVPAASIEPPSVAMPLLMAVAPVEQQGEAGICQFKRLPVRQEPVIEIEEPPANDESIIEIDSASSVSMDTSSQSQSSETAVATNEEAFSNQMYALMLRDIDEEDGDNPQLVSEYAKDIYHYMMTLEELVPIRQNHLNKQPEVNGRMRSILVDWLIQVHQRFHLLQETLFLTVAILDRYLQTEFVPKTKLQLVGVASMWVAAKYEEMYAPEVADFAYITDHAYTKAEIRQMECAILRALDFSFGRPLPIHFLRRFSKAGDVDARTHNLAKYFMELAMVPCETAHVKPSYMAAGALRLAQKLLGEYNWGPLMVFYTSYDEDTLVPLMAKLAQIALTAGSGKTKAVKTKYQSSKLMKVSTLDNLNSEYLHEVASWPMTPVFAS